MPAVLRGRPLKRRIGCSTVQERRETTGPDGQTNYESARQTRGGQRNQVNTSTEIGRKRMGGMCCAAPSETSRTEHQKWKTGIRGAEWKQASTRTDRKNHLSPQAWNESTAIGEVTSRPQSPLPRAHNLHIAVFTPTYPVPRNTKFTVPHPDRYTQVPTKTRDFPRPHGS